MSDMSMHEPKARAHAAAVALRDALRTARTKESPPTAGR